MCACVQVMQDTNAFAQEEPSTPKHTPMRVQVTHSPCHNSSSDSACMLPMIENNVRWLDTEVGCWKVIQLT